MNCRHRSPSALLSVFAATFLLATSTAHADEGMWTFDNVPRDKIQKTYGFEITDEWLEDVRLSAVKVGASGSFVSGEGLVMTNHHVAVNCVQQLSTADRDYVENGFYAKTRADEMRCPEIEVKQLVGIRDVTAKIEAATRGRSGERYADARRAAIAKEESACSKGKKKWPWSKRRRATPPSCEVVKLYHGGLYHLYEYRTFRDVRLVFAPEVAAASFGGDPDNYNYPRYNLDVAFLRAYEGGEPASTPHHFTFSAAGPEPDELLFIAGNPGTTERLLTVSQLRYLRDAGLPDRLLRLSERRGRLIEFGQRGPEQERIARRALYSTENYIKRYYGQFTALDDAMIAEKKSAEDALRESIEKDPKRRAAYADAWKEIATAQVAKRRLDTRYLQLESGQGLSSRLFDVARMLVRGAEERAKPSGKRLREFRDAALPSLEQKLFSEAPVYPDLEELELRFALTAIRQKLGPDDDAVKTVLGKKSPEQLARELVANSKLADVDLRKKLWKGGKSAIEASEDPMIALARAIDPAAREIRAAWESEVESPEDRNAQRVAAAYFEEYGTDTYPDATRTLRLSYGTMKGYEKDGKAIPPFTTFGGAFGRQTGQAPFALPPRWNAAREKVPPDTPLNFVSAHDTHGGNSGSPVINRRAEIVGILFDRNLEGLKNAFLYDPSQGRTVSVHSAAILEALESIYDAQALRRELEGGARRSEN